MRSTASASPLALLLLFPVIALQVAPAAAQDAAPVLVTDITSGTQAGDPSGFAAIGGTIYFASAGQVGGTATGRELWKTDGTGAGTVFVKDVNPGTAASDPALLTPVGTTLFFRASGGTSLGFELYKSDGTDAGTVLVKDINPGASGSGIANVVAFNGLLVFTANDGVNGVALWRSDGTAGGTQLVKDIRTGTTDPGVGLMTVVGSTLYFVANDGVSGVELWKTDGTTAGTQLVKDLNAGAGNATPYGLRNLDGVLTFGAYTPATGSELWRTDGSAAGTVLVRDINPGAANANPVNFAVAGTTLFFSADNGTGIGTELWRSDGTAANTVLVKDINPSAGSAPSNLVAAGTSVFFRADDGTTGRELWTSDGTAPGTVLVRDLVPGPGASTIGVAAAMGTVLYFANDGDEGNELWRSDGTAGGTFILEDIYPGPESSFPLNLFVLDGTLYVNAIDPDGGREPYRTDGTASGTQLVKDVNTLPSGSFPGSLTNVRGALYFVAFHRPLGNELWKSDGTTAGTRLVRDIEPENASSAPGSLTDLNGTVLFSAFSSATGRELWRSDGTTAGTVLVRDIAPGTVNSNPSSLVALGSRVYFAANDGVVGTELWASDGTAGGTVLLKDITAGTASSSPSNLVNVNGTLFFTVANLLWKSDGTAAGTVPVFDLASAGSTGFARLTNVGGRLFFISASGSGLPELWVSDTANLRVGAGGNTSRLRQFASGTQPNFLTDVNGTLFFAASDNPGAGLTGQELWKSNGTVGGTVLVKDVAPGAGGSNVFWIVNANGLVLFAANDGVTGGELWRSDGTTAGTTLVKDIAPGADASTPNLLTNVNGTVYFAATRPGEGTELWKTDGTPAGTVLVADLAPGAASSSPQVLTNVNGTLFLSADNQVVGAELYRMATGVPQPIVGTLGHQFTGGQNAVFGANFTPGAVVKYFVATAAGPVSVGPFTPSFRSQTAIGVFLPPEVSLGNGFAAVQVINTDAGFRESNVSPALLFGNPADGIPSITSINGTGLPPADLAIGVAHIDTVVGKGTTVTIGGTGFNAPVVNVFTAAGNIGPLPALPGGTSTQFQITIPAGAPTGPGNFQVVNTVGFKASNAVSSVLGATPTITSVTATATTVTVNGTGFSTLSVINLFNLQGGAAVNLGGLAGGVAAVPLTIVSDTQFTFQRPAGAVTGPAFVEVLNPPFIPFASSGDDPDGAFNFPAPAPSLFTDIGAGDAAGHAAGALEGDGAESAGGRADGRGDGDAARRGVRTERVAWTHPTGGAAIAGDELGAPRVVGAGDSGLSAEPTRPIGPPAKGRAGARSSRAVLRGDGAVSWRVEGDGDAAAGFGHADADGSLRDLDFALRVVAITRELRVVEGGVERARVGTYAPGDRLRVTVRDGVVEYWRNTALLWTSTAAPRYPLVVDASLAGAARVTGARVRGDLGTLVEWRSDSLGVRNGSTRVTADRALRVTTRDDDVAGAVEATLDGRAGLGLATRDGRLAYRVVRDGFRVRVEHAGALRGEWAIAPGTRVGVAVGHDGVVRYLADGQILDGAPLADGSPLRAAGWLDGPGGGASIGQATVEDTRGL